MKIKDRYETDVAFRTLVDMFHAVIEKAEFTPTEIREAAMLAQIKYESYHPRPVIFTREQIERGML